MKLLWDQSGERFYENGVRRGVIYPWNTTTGWYGTGVAWNGLTSVQVTPSGGEANAQYADDMKYLNLYSVEENGATVECFTYPDEFTECDGSAIIEGTNGLMARAQNRKQFGFCWRTNVGNDETEEAGYILHILYGCKASPSERQYQTINDSPEPISFSYEITTVPPAMPATLSDYKNTALFEIDSRKFVTTAQQALLSALEDKLYGTANTDPELPTIEELVALLGATSYKITWSYKDGANDAVVLKETQCLAGEIPVYTGNVPVVTDETFVGWNTSASGTEDNRAAASANATYYAIYTAG